LTDSTEYWIEKSKEQYNRDRFGEALVSAEKAIEIDEDAVNGWWFAALSSEALGDIEEALLSLITVTEQAPYFANGWARYGAVLQKMITDFGDDYGTNKDNSRLSA